MNKIQLTADQFEEAEQISEEIIEQGRWSTLYRYILQYEGTFYECHIRQGSTENQPGYWEDNDSVECHEVHQVEKVFKVWEKVK
jgi:hypothetical protein